MSLFNSAANCDAIFVYRLDNGFTSKTSVISRLISSEETKGKTTLKPQAENKINLSDACIKRLTEITKAENDKFLRVIVDGGGCSGFQYKFELDNQIKDDDLVFGPSNDIRVVVDAISMEYCAGATIDYQTELIKSGFRIMDNPKAEQGCSCGASFALKMD